MTYENIPGAGGNERIMLAIAALRRTMVDGLAVPSDPSQPGQTGSPFPGDQKPKVPFPGSASEDTPKESSEPAHGPSYETDRPRPDTLVVDMGWGKMTDQIPLSERSSVLRGFFAEQYARDRVNQGIRATLEARGVRIEERRRPDEGLRENEAVAGGNVDEKALGRALPNIAPEVNAIPIQDYESFARNPTFPILLYVEGLAGGAGKYPLDTPEQFEKIKQLLEDEPSVKQQQVSNLTFRPIIETPSDRFTSFRVLTTGAGDVVASGLLYSQESAASNVDVPSDSPPVDPNYYATNMLDYFTNPRSPYNLNARNITSNVHGGGGCIPLDPTDRSRPVTDEEREILAAHGMQDQQVPAPIKSAAQKIARRLGCEGALVYGFDFIMDKQGNISFLEPNTGPGVQVMNEVEHGGDKNTEQGYGTLMNKTVDSVFPAKGA